MKNSIRPIHHGVSHARMHTLITLNYSAGGRITGITRHENAVYEDAAGYRYRAVNMHVRAKIPFGQHRPGKLTKNPIPARVVKAARFEKM